MAFKATLITTHLLLLSSRLKPQDSIITIFPQLVTVNTKILGRTERHKMEKTKSLMESNTSLKDSIRAIKDSSNKRLHQSNEEAVFNMDDVLTWPPRSYTCSFCRREFRSAQALGGHMNVHRKDRARLKGSSPPRDIGQYKMTTTTPSTNSTLNLNLNKLPNPNPNFLSTSPSSSPSSTSLVGLFGTTLPSLISPLPPPPRPRFSVASSENMKWVLGGNLFDSPLSFKASDFSTKTKNARANSWAVGDRRFDGLIGEEDQDQRCIKSSNLKKGAEIVRLDLEIGVLGDDSNYKEELDLELRLGPTCSNFF